MASPESDTKLNHDLYPEEWRNDYKDIKLVQSIDKPDQLKGKRAETGSWTNLGWPPLEESIEEAYKDYKDHPIDITESQKPVDGEWNNVPVTVIGVKYLFNGKEYAVVKGTNTLNSFIPKDEIAWNGSSKDRKVSTHPLSEIEVLQMQLEEMTKDRNRWKARAEQLESELEVLSGEMNIVKQRLDNLEGKKMPETEARASQDAPITGPHTAAARDEAERRAASTPPAASAGEIPPAEAPQAFKRGDRVVVTNPNGTTVKGRVDSDVYPDGGTQRIKVIDDESNVLTPTIDRVDLDRAQATGMRAAETTVSSETTNNDQRYELTPSRYARFRGRLLRRPVVTEYYRDSNGQAYVVDDSGNRRYISDREIEVNQSNGIGAVLAVGAAALALFGVSYIAHEVEEVEHRQGHELVQKDYQIANFKATINHRLSHLHDLIIGARNAENHRLDILIKRQKAFHGQDVRIAKHAHRHERLTLSSILRQVHQDRLQDLGVTDPQANRAEQDGK